VAGQDQLKVEIRQQGETAVVSLAGELDLASAPRLEKEIAGLDGGLTATVVLDLQGLQFIDSTGLRTILSTQARLRDRGAAFAITPGSPQVQRLLAITRADEHLRVVDTPDDILV
jgi:anti-sigma B factor antagonist